MHAFRSLEGKACVCPVCLVLVRIGQAATDPTQSAFFHGRALEELRIFHGRLLDFSEIDKANQRALTSTGTPHPEEVKRESGAPEKAPPKEGAKKEEGSESPKEAEEKAKPERRSRSLKKERKKRAKKSRSRSRHKKKKRSHSKSSPTRHVGNASSGSNLRVKAKEELSGEEAEREPVEDVKDQESDEHPPAILELQPKVKGRPVSRPREASEESTPTDRECERSPLPRAHRRDLRAPHPPDHPPSWHRDSAIYWESRRPPPYTAKGKKKRERQQEIRRLGWDEFHASKGSKASR